MSALDPESSTYRSNFSANTIPTYDSSQWFSGGPHSGSTFQSHSNYGNYDGFIDNNSMTQPGYSPDEEDFDNEPPLLEELGIRFDHIWSKTQAVIHPFKDLPEGIMEDADLAGPLVFCLLLGGLLLLAGKIHFGYIYGFSVFGCLGLNALLNLMSEQGRGLDLWLTCSVLGYCLLPVLCLAGIAAVTRLQTWLGSLLSVVVIAWATHAATRLFVLKMALQTGAHYLLIAYPVMLLYFAFVLITIF